MQFDTDLIDIIDGGKIYAAVYAMSYVESYTTLIAFMLIYGTAYIILYRQKLGARDILNVTMIPWDNIIIT